VRDGDRSILLNAPDTGVDVAGESKEVLFCVPSWEEPNDNLRCSFSISSILGKRRKAADAGDPNVDLLELLSPPTAVFSPADSIPLVSLSQKLEIDGVIGCTSTNGENTSISSIPL